MLTGRVAFCPDGLSLLMSTEDRLEAGGVFSLPFFELLNQRLLRDLDLPPLGSASVVAPVLVG